MSLSQNFDNLYDALNVSSVTSLLGTYGSGYALFADSRIPSDYTSIAPSVNFYLSGTFNSIEGYTITTMTINCRAATSLLSRALADAVITAINRVNFTGYYITCTALPEIGPADETDNYNTIVQATMQVN